MAAIWKRPITVEMLTERHVDTAVGLLGIEFLEVGDDFLKARVQVNKRTRQPAGILHGGVSVVLAECLGSVGAACSSPPGQRVVGLDINANHIRSAGEGEWITGMARPYHIGRTTHVWHIELTNEKGKLTCVSRITMAILPKEG
jgi:1,4-dihydroxy-2-naphthoyl-CoA hydrolase